MYHYSSTKYSQNESKAENLNDYGKWVLMSGVWQGVEIYVKGNGIESELNYIACKS